MKPLADGAETMTSLHERLIKTGVHRVRHGRHAIFQLAQAAVPRATFADTGNLISNVLSSRCLHNRYRRPIGAMQLLQQEQYVRTRPEPRRNQSVWLHYMVNPQHPMRRTKPSFGSWHKMAEMWCLPTLCPRKAAQNGKC